MPETYKPDTLSKFIKFQNAIEDFTNKLAEELGEFHPLVTDCEMIFARVIDITDDIENITCGTYD